MNQFSPDLENILSEMCKMRKAYVSLKNENATLFKLSEKQKQQLDKSRNRCQKLMDLFTAKYKVIMEKNTAVNGELKYMRQVIEDLQSQLKSQSTELKCKENLFSSLEEEMEVLRSKIDLQADEHKKNIETILDRNRVEKNREIAQYQAKLDSSNAEVIKHKKNIETMLDRNRIEKNIEIAQYQAKLDSANAEIERLKEQINNQSIEIKTKSRKSSSSHPALSDSENDTPKGRFTVRRRKFPENRWPKLNITSTKTEQTPKTPEYPVKRKKLFLLDNDTIVDLETP